jgi:hypothetical protein
MLAAKDIQMHKPACLFKHTSSSDMVTYLACMHTPASSHTSNLQLHSDLFFLPACLLVPYTPILQGSASRGGVWQAGV